MSELGVLLKEARQKKGYTLDDVQEMTKIRVRYLEAIEAGDYNVLPGSFYARAFIKNYAEAVGLDADELLQQHQNEVPALPTEPAAEPMMKPRRASARASDRWSKWGFGLLLWCFLALIAVIVYMFVINNPNDPPRVVDETNLTDATDTPTDNEEQPGGTDAPGNDGGETEGEQPPVTDPTPGNDGNEEEEPEQPTSGEGTLTPVGDITSRTANYEISPIGINTYEIIVDGESWVEFRNEKTEERLVFETLSNTTRTFELSEPVYIRLGFAPSVEIKVNGEVLYNGGEAGTDKRYFITPVDSPSTNEGAQ
ncbi:helix-turn-helix domain-containing protein [Paenibacillus daejeonensis]|uniref:helix-turn-helix domain-containing protein n=1 Tax=Paenibacillus daejeonensis TaxID=135193 RepID=UPI000360A3AE|nr:helix-turn-helix domain-containing protein [Paenibacillus daejeonensis]